MKNRHGAKLLLVGLLLVYTLSFVSSVNIGISPASIRFSDVMRGGFAERYIVVSADSVDFVSVSIIPRGDVSDWLNFEVENFEVSKDNPYYLRISVTPPIDTPNGNYTGFLQVATETFSSSIEEHAVGKVRSNLDLTIFVSVTDVELLDCVASNIEISSAEEGDDIMISMDIFNNGNIKIDPRVLVDVWDQDQLSVLLNEELKSPMILPTLEEHINLKFSSKGLSVGQYWSEISIPDCLREVLLTFDILEEGAMKANGVLLNILSKAVAKRDETVPFEVGFKNIGEKSVSAYFKGQATYNGKVVQLFETEKMDVMVDSIENFNFFFTPTKSGKYIISGRIYYDGKRTFEGSRVLEVEGGAGFIPFIYGAFLILIGFLFYKIRRENASYSKKLRMFK